MGTRDDGRPDRRHVRGQTRAEVARKVRALERARESGDLSQVGRAWSVEQWLTWWLVDIQPHVKPSTFEGYERAVRVHLVPGLGAHRLTALRASHIETLYSGMLRRVTKRGTPMRRAAVHQVHRVLRTSLNAAVRDDHLPNNPASRARIPRAEEAPFEVEPYTVEEVKQLLSTAATVRNGARWVVALALGLRQGEALGLRWEDIDGDTQTITVRRARVRPRWAHGCSGAACGRQAGHCSARRALTPTTDSTKSQAGRRVVGLPDPLVLLLRAHKARQAEERLRAGSLWQGGEGWVFASEVGAPINPRTDWSRWKELLTTAGVRDARLHDARHTAATSLLLLGVSPRVAMAMMGWTDASMLSRYQHVGEPIRAVVAEQLGHLLWGDGEATETTN